MPGGNSQHHSHQEISPEGAGIGPEHLDTEPDAAARPKQEILQGRRPGPVRNNIPEDPEAII